MAPRDLLHDVFGFSDFRPGQAQVCEALLAGRPAVAVFPTGGGKSLCYQLPALLLEGTTLVVSPLLALMKDQVDWLCAKGVRAARLDSTLGAEQSRAVFASMASGDLKLLFVAPERFLNERFVERIARANISLLAIDEAHCISQWGHNFRPEYLKLATHAQRLGIRRVLALTATATPPVVSDIAEAFHIAPGDRVLAGFYRPNLALEFEPVTRDTRDEALLRQSFAGPTIVYVTLQKTAERVATLLGGRGVAARAYHAGMEAEERARVQEAFMDGEHRVIVATIAFGMGIDKANIRAVIHYNLPKCLESYAQEIGRAGRDGLPSECRMLACRDDLPTLANFAYGDTPTLDSVTGVLRAVFHTEGSVSFRSLSDAHDMRELVVKTLVTYLELDGWVARGTPIYTEYRWKFLQPRETIVASFDPARAAFLGAVFDGATAGRTWHRLDLGAAAERLGEPRDRVVRALDYLAEKGQLELVATGVQERIVVQRRPADLPALAAELCARFEAMETREVARVREIAAFVEADSCHTRRLVAYFGEDLGRDCGHCTRCRTGTALLLPAPTPPPPLPGREVLTSLRAEFPVLASPRVVARFCCGVTSPALSKARLGRHPLFGAASDRDFREVMGWAASTD